MKDTTCWRCSRVYDPRYAECPHCEAANANHDLERAQAQAERLPGQGCGTLPDGGYECVCGQCPPASAEEVMRPETVYEKSARWAWPDGRPDL